MLSVYFYDYKTLSIVYVQNESYINKAIDCYIFKSISV